MIFSSNKNKEFDANIKNVNTRKKLKIVSKAKFSADPFGNFYFRIVGEAEMSRHIHTHMTDIWRPQICSRAPVTFACGTWEREREREAAGWGGVLLCLGKTIASQRERERERRREDWTVTRVSPLPFHTQTHTHTHSQPR
jgi:hypothetical protein